MSPYSYISAAPIFLADKTSGLNQETINAINEGNFKKVLIVGGSAVVPDSVMDQLALSNENIERLSGENRYQTSIAIAEHSIKNTELAHNNAVFATGANFPDALAGGAFAAAKKTVLILVEDSADGREAIDSFVKKYSAEIGKGYLLGGTSAIPNNLAGDIEAASKN